MYLNDQLLLWVPLERSCFVPVEMEPSLNSYERHRGGVGEDLSQRDQSLSELDASHWGAQSPKTGGLTPSFVSNIWADP